MASEKGIKGFQRELENGRRINLYLDQETIDFAKVIGSGNVSEGIRKAVMTHVLVELEIKK